VQHFSASLRLFVLLTLPFDDSFAWRQLKYQTTVVFTSARFRVIEHAWKLSVFKIACMKGFSGRQLHRRRFRCKNWNPCILIWLQTKKQCLHLGVWNNGLVLAEPRKRVKTCFFHVPVHTELHVVNRVCCIQVYSPKEYSFVTNSIPSS